MKTINRWSILYLYTEEKLSNYLKHKRLIGTKSTKIFISLYFILSYSFNACMTLSLTSIDQGSRSKSPIQNLMRFIGYKRLDYGHISHNKHVRFITIYNYLTPFTSLIPVPDIKQRNTEIILFWWGIIEDTYMVLVGGTLHSLEGRYSVKFPVVLLQSFQNAAKRGSRESMKSFDRRRISIRY